MSFDDNKIVKIANNSLKINTNTNSDTLKEKYYDDLFYNLKEHQYGNTELTSNQEKDLNTIVTNALDYASETIAKRDGNGSKNNAKDGTVDFSEWATESTYEFLDLDINNQNCKEQMESIFSTMDKDGNGKLDEKELMAVYFYKDATSGGMPNENKEIVFDGIVNSGKERKGIAANMVSLADEKGKTLFNNIFALINTNLSPEVKKQTPDEKPGSLNSIIEDSAQGNTGDCWLLAGLNSLSYSKKGKEIIQNSIINNGNDTYTVNFKGVQQSYTFSKTEIEEARNSGQYSTGDYDVLLMEIATKKFLEELREGKIEISPDAPDFLDSDDYIVDDNGQYISNPINDGRPSDTLYLLTGQKANNQYNLEHSCYSYLAQKYGIEADNPYEGCSAGTSLNYAYDKIEENKGNIWAALTTVSNDGQAYETTDINGNKVILASAERHAFSIKSVDVNIVTLVNPWDSNMEIKITKDELEKITADIYFNVL